MNTVKRQKGMTAIAMVLVLGMVGFFAMVAIRLFPIYLEHFSVASHLNSLAEDASIKDKSNREILSTLKKRFDIDDVKNVKEENIFIEHNKNNSMVIAVEYEVRTPVIGNIDMMVSFIDEVVVD